QQFLAIASRGGRSFPYALQVGTQRQQAAPVLCAERSRSFAFAPGELGFGPLELAQALLRFALEAVGDEAVLSIDSAITAFGTLCLVPGTLGGEPALGERIVAIGLEEYLTAYLDDGGLRGDPKGPLFRAIGSGTGRLTRTVLPQANAYAMIGRRAAAAGIATRLGNDSFRATGITAYLKNGGTLERAAAMANHASTRMTQLYDRRRDDVGPDEVERIAIQEAN